MAQLVRPATPFGTDPGDELPVGVQLAWRLRALIAAGRIAPGERMPSVRALADWAAVNVNTVRGVYSRLEDEGLIETRHGLGSFVAERAGGDEEVERIAAEAIAAAEAAGVNPRDVAIVALVSSSLPADALADLPETDEAESPAELGELARELELTDPRLEGDERAARAELRRQIGRLEAALAPYRRELGSPDPTAPKRAPEPRLADVGELERTRDALLAQLADARASAERSARAERRAREVRDSMVNDPGAHRWDVVSSADTGEEGCVSWEVAPRMGPLGALMSWWRVKVSGGCPLAAPPQGGSGAGDPPELSDGRISR